MTLCRFSSLAQVLSCCDKQSVFVCGTEMLWSAVQLSLGERWGRSVISICTCGQTECHLESQRRLFGCSDEGKVQAASTCKGSSTWGIFLQYITGTSFNAVTTITFMIYKINIRKDWNRLFCVCYGWKKKLQAHRNSSAATLYAACVTSRFFAGSSRGVIVLTDP